MTSPPCRSDPTGHALDTSRHERHKTRNFRQLRVWLLCSGVVSFFFRFFERQLVVGYESSAFRGMDQSVPVRMSHQGAYPRVPTDMALRDWKAVLIRPPIARRPDSSLFVFNYLYAIDSIGWPYRTRICSAASIYSSLHQIPKASCCNPLSINICSCHRNIESSRHEPRPRCHVRARVLP